MINITGRDRPGVTAELTAILGNAGAEILDVGQAVIHDHLSLGMLISLKEPNSARRLLSDLESEAGTRRLHLEHQPITPERYTAWVREQRKSRHVITLLGRKLCAVQISRVAAAVAEAGLNIDQISRLSGRLELDGPRTRRRACVEFAVSGDVADAVAMRRSLFAISQDTGVDISFHADNLYRRSRRLVAFDMDSTLIQAEVIDELAKVAGSGAEVAQVTEAAMRGEIDFQESLRRRVGTLKGLEQSALDEIGARLPLTDGVERLAATLRRLGYKLAIISGGFDFFGNILKQKLGFDYVFANRLEIADGKLTGRVLGDIVDGPRKAAILRDLAEQEGLAIEQTIAVGDGANDLPMLGVAGMGVAFHPKPIVAERAKRTIQTTGLDGLLYLLGIRDRELDAEPSDGAS